MTTLMKGWVAMVWNAPEYHLLVNHVSVMAAPIALVIFAVGWMIKNRSVENTGLAVFVFSAFGAFASDKTGGGAAHFVKNLPEFQHDLIHAHAAAAHYAVVLCYIAGGLASILLWMSWAQRKKLTGVGKGLLVLVALMGVAALARTAHLGGLIRHSEIRAAASLN